MSRCEPWSSAVPIKTPADISDEGEEIDSIAGSDKDNDMSPDLKPKLEDQKKVYVRYFKSFSVQLLSPSVPVFRFSLLYFNFFYSLC